MSCNCFPSDIFQRLHKSLVSASNLDLMAYHYRNDMNVLKLQGS
jgi:hypothetical protein